MFKFLAKFAGVQADKTADALMTTLIKWDPKGATEAEIRAVREALSEFSIKCEEARTKMNKEVAEAEEIKQVVADKIELAKKWKAEIDNPATDASRKAKLEGELPKLMDELAKLGPKVDKEVKEAEMATKLFETYDQVVITTNEKLATKIAQAEELTSSLEIAKVEEQLANEQVKAAEVLAGINKARDSFDVASSVIAKETQAIKDRTAAKEREADLLAGHKKDDSFVQAELAEMTGKGKTNLSFEDQLAALSAKVK